MKRLAALVLAVAASSLPVSVLAEPLAVAAPEKVGLSPDRLARIGTLLNSEIANGNLPGAVVLVARRGKVAFFESFGFADKAAGRRMPRDAIFRIYSMTKPLTTVAAMMLVEEGRLQLTDPVSKYLPAFKAMEVVVVPGSDEARGRVGQTVPAQREITIHDLLRHTSGIVYPGSSASATVKDGYAKAGLGPDVDEEKLTPAEFTERLARAPLSHHPGTTWEYGLSTDLLGRVIEALAGRRLGEFLEERVFRPLQMADSGFWVPKEKIGRLAQPLALDPQTGKPIEILDVSSIPGNDLGGAGGVSTAMDYLRFCEMLRGGGRLGTVRLLSRTTVDLMTADHLGPRIPAPIAPGELIQFTPGYTFGLGFAVRQGAGMAGVAGSAGEYLWGGYGGTYFWIDPKEELSAVYMSQSPGPGRVPSRRVVKQLVLQAIAD